MKSQINEKSKATQWPYRNRVTPEASPKESKFDQFPDQDFKRTITKILKDREKYYPRQMNIIKKKMNSWYE